MAEELDVESVECVEYTSSPKDLEDRVCDVMHEWSSIRGGCRRLRQFLKYPTAGVPAQEKALMVDQLEAMQTYEKLLHKRLIHMVNRVEYV